MFSSKCPLCGSELNYYLEHIHPDCYRDDPFLACDNCSHCGWGFEPDDFNYVIMLNNSGEIISEKISIGLPGNVKDGYLIINDCYHKQCYIFFSENSSSITLDNVYMSVKDIDKIKNYAMLA